MVVVLFEGGGDYGWGWGGGYGEGYEDLLRRRGIDRELKRFAGCVLYDIAATVVFMDNLTEFACIWVSKELITKGGMAQAFRAP